VPTRARRVITVVVGARVPIATILREPCTLAHCASVAEGTRRAITTRARNIYVAAAVASLIATVEGARVVISTRDGLVCAAETGRTALRAVAELTIIARSLIFHRCGSTTLSIYTFVIRAAIAVITSHIDTQAFTKDTGVITRTDIVVIAFGAIQQRSVITITRLGVTAFHGTFVLIIAIHRLARITLTGFTEFLTIAVVVVATSNTVRRRLRGTTHCRIAIVLSTALSIITADDVTVTNSGRTFIVMRTKVAVITRSRVVGKGTKTVV